MKSPLVQDCPAAVIASFVMLGLFLSTPPIRAGTLASQSFRVDGRLTPGGGRQSSSSFLISCGGGLPGDGRAASESFVIWSGCVALKVALSAVEPSKPENMMSFRASPNPFPGQVALHYALPHDATVAVSIYDVSGRLVRDFKPGRQAAGPHRLDWDGLDGHGRSVPAGLYLYRVGAAGHERAGRMIKLN